MKKAIIGICLFIAFIVIYVLQSNFFSWFTIAGVKPNIFVIFVLFIGLFTGKNIGFASGVVVGLILDFFIGRKIGVSAAMLGIVGFIAGYLDKNFSKESRLTIMLMVAGATFLYEAGVYIINIFIFSYLIELGPFITKLLIEIIYNVILTIILYPLIQRAGFYIEEKFKGNKILTRYY